MPSQWFHIRQKWNESRHFSIAFRLRTENNYVSAEQHFDVESNEMPLGTCKIQPHTHTHTHLTRSHMTQKWSNMLAIRIWNGYALCTSYDWFIIIVLAKRSQSKQCVHDDDADCVFAEFPRNFFSLCVSFSFYNFFRSFVMLSKEKKSDKWQSLSAFGFHTWNWDAVMRRKRFKRFVSYWANQWYIWM